MSFNPLVAHWAMLLKNQEAQDFDAFAYLDFPGAWTWRVEGNTGNPVIQKYQDLSFGPIYLQKIQSQSSSQMERVLLTD